MAAATLALVWGASVAQAASDPSIPTTRIVNGVKLTDDAYSRNWPYLVSLQRSKLETEFGLLGFSEDEEIPVSDLTRHICGGSVIAPRLVLTAAHCVALSSFLGFEQGAVTLSGNYSVLYGSRRLDEKKSTADRRVDVEDVFIHPDYVGSRARHDVAVLRLSKPIPGAVPVGLPTEADAALWGAGAGLPSGARIAGWGLTMKKRGRITQPGVAQAADMPIVSDRWCGDTERVGTLPSLPFEPRFVICTGKPDTDRRPVKSSGVSACFGDSGGPLAVVGPGGAPVLVGVASYVDVRVNFGLCEGYSYYSRVASDVAWIRSVAEAHGGPQGIEPPAATVLSTSLSSARLRLTGPTTGPAALRYEVHGNVLGPLFRFFIDSPRKGARSLARHPVVRLSGGNAAVARTVRRIDEDEPDESRFERRFGELIKALLQRQPIPLVHTSGTTATIPGLVPSSRRNTVEYRLYLRSVDVDGNPSSLTSVKVKMPVDASPPTRPGAPRLAYRLDSDGDWFLRWKRARDNDRVGGYMVEYRKKGARKWRRRFVGWNASYIFGPQPRISYQVRVRAVDAAGNEGRASRIVTQAPAPCGARCDDADSEDAEDEDL